MSENNSTEIKCTDCGKTATVPFKPTAGKPVYCKECLPKHRTPRRDSGPGNRMDTRPPKQATEENAWARRRENWHK
jgi:CxxC-x17-CxxC domain-containing protein